MSKKPTTCEHQEDEAFIKRVATHENKEKNIVEDYSISFVSKKNHNEYNRQKTNEK